MKLLVSIGSCLRDRYNGANRAMRETWLNELNSLGADHRFFSGCSSSEVDEIEVDCPDDYEHLSLKTQAACKYALDNGYTHLFQCFTDCYARPDRLLNSGSHKLKYTGFHGNHPVAVNYASGGAGYWLDAECMEMVSNGTGHDWAEDRWVGNILAEHGIHCVFDGRYRPKRYDITPGDDIISTHLSLGTGNYQPSLMRELHQRWLDSN